MSVMSIAPEVFSYVHQSVRRTGYETSITCWFSQTLHLHFRSKDVEAESTRLVKNWCNLNDLSYSGKYKEDVQGMSEFIEFYKGYNVNVIQSLKFLQCIEYNIETEHFAIDEQDEQDIKLLRAYISEMTGGIIHDMPEYKEAAWSDIPVTA